jgi:hypothetical protein
MCSIQNGIGRYELIQTVDIEWHVFKWTKGVLAFLWQMLFWTGSRVARGKLASCVRHQLNYCRLCPRVGDPCRKRNCSLNRSLGTLQLSRAPINVNVVSVAVLWLAPYECAVARHVKVENFHLFQSGHHYQRNSEFWWKLFSALCHIVFAYYALIKTAHKLGYQYM